MARRDARKDKYAEKPSLTHSKSASRELQVLACTASHMGTAQRRRLALAPRRQRRSGPHGLARGCANNTLNHDKSKILLRQSKY